MLAISIPYARKEMATQTSFHPIFWSSGLQSRTVDDLMAVV